MFLTGCASGNITASPSSSIPVFVRNTQGQTVARIQDSNVYKPDGTRVARIASDGNIYNTSGVRVGRISK
jgi:hypothetical protein